MAGSFFTLMMAAYPTYSLLQLNYEEMSRKKIIVKKIIGGKKYE